MFHAFDLYKCLSSSLCSKGVVHVQLLLISSYLFRCFVANVMKVLVKKN